MKGTNWTASDKVDFLLRRVPWTVVRDDSAEYPILRCREIPDATGSGDTPEEAEGDFWESLKASLESFVHFGDRPPVPSGAILPWEQTAAAKATPMRVSVVGGEKKKSRVLSEPARTSMPSTKFEGEFLATR